MFELPVRSHESDRNIRLVTNEDLLGSSKGEIDDYHPAADYMHSQASNNHLPHPKVVTDANTGNFRLVGVEDYNYSNKSTALKHCR